jgi:hypothetical protein
VEYRRFISRKREREREKVVSVTNENNNLREDVILRSAGSSNGIPLMNVRNESTTIKVLIAVKRDVGMRNSWIGNGKKEFFFGSFILHLLSTLSRASIMRIIKSSLAGILRSQSLEKRHIRKDEVVRTLKDKLSPVL